MHAIDVADPIIRFEAARALLGHAAVLGPDQVRGLVDESRTYYWTVEPEMLSGLLQAAWWRAAKEHWRQETGEIPSMPPLPVVPRPGGTEDVLAEHTTCSGQSRLVLHWADDGALELLLQRHAPIQRTRPERLLLAALADDWSPMRGCDCGCDPEDVDLVEDPFAPVGDMVDQAAWWLAWRRQDGDVPEWALDVAERALVEYARRKRVAAPDRVRAVDRLRATLAELADLDSRLDHTPDAGTGPEWDRRNQLAHAVLGWAAVAGMRVGKGWDDTSPYPTVMYADLPTGQVSWHLPAPPAGVPHYDDPWDGHSRTAKAGRIAAWLAEAADQAEKTTRG